MTIELGCTVKGTVVSIADYGAIVRLAGGKTGLIHISEIADTYVRNVREYLSEEDEVTVKVLRMNDKGRYELSLKQGEARKTEQRELVPTAARAPVAESFERRSSTPQRPAATFEDRLSRFLEDSEQRQHDLKRHLETKRGRK